MVRTSAGEDQVVSCETCGYAANMEKASSKLEPVDDLPAEGDGKPLEVHTPGQKTVEEVARFLGVSPRNKIKTWLSSPRKKMKKPANQFPEG